MRRRSERPALVALEVSTLASEALRAADQWRTMSRRDGTPYTVRRFKRHTRCDGERIALHVVVVRQKAVSS